MNGEMGVLLMGMMALLACTSRSESPAKIRVIIDSDANNELDDQHAIAYVLLSGDVFDVDGIAVNATSSGGDIEAHAAEAERIVKLCDMYPTIPVYRGANGAFDEIRASVDTPGFDGAEAVDYIIRSVHDYAPDTLIFLPVGKLTNIALALKKDPSIARNVRIVWLGSNYPEPGEYNQENDQPALNYILDLDVPFEIALVRYGEPSGTDAVRVTPADMETHMPGMGPHVEQPVVGRHGGEFTNFGDYSIDLFHHIDLYGDPPSRALFDMAAVAIVKNPAWATPARIPAPILVDGKWQDRPDNPRTITLWEHFDRDAILNDFFGTMSAYVLVGHD